MKYSFIAIILLMSNTMLAQDTLHVFVNNKHAVHFISNAEPGKISLKKYITSSAKNISIQLNRVDKTAGPYKPTIEITDCNEEKSSIVNIDENNYTAVDITGNLKKYNFFKGCYVKIYLLLNSANERMMIPSRRIYLGDLTIK